MYFEYSKNKKNSMKEKFVIFITLMPFIESSSLNSIRAVPRLINARSTESFSWLYINTNGRRKT